MYNLLIKPYRRDIKFEYDPNFLIIFEKTDDIEIAVTTVFSVRCKFNSVSRNLQGEMKSIITIVGYLFCVILC